MLKLNSNEFTGENNTLSCLVQDEKKLTEILKNI